MFYNVEAMTSKGIRSDALSTDTKLDASYNVELTTETFIGYSLCYLLGFIIINFKTNIKMEQNLEFSEFPKMARLSREIIITEKIDGTNAQILITEDGQVLTGSRTRWITPQDDNFGFAKWVEENKQEILKLGVGRHFGEWWGSGIQRGYNLPKGEKRFSLFNVSRWVLFGTEPQRIPTADPRIEKYQDVLPECIGLVPILYRGIFDTAKVDEVLNDLKVNGSYASKGFMKPEGVVVFHIAGNLGFKKTIEKDEVPKSQYAS